MPHFSPSLRSLKYLGISMVAVLTLTLGVTQVAPVAHAEPVSTSPVTEPVSTSPSSGKTGTTGITLQNPLKVDSLTDLLKLVLDAVVKLGTIALTLAIIWVGFMFVMARGNEEKIRTARSALVWTIIGGLILLGAQAIGLVIQSTVNTL